MNRVASCPDARRLQQFLLGSLPEDECEQLTHHLSVCGQCLRMLSGLRANDALSDALRAGAGMPRASNAQVDSLKQRLRGLMSVPPRDDTHGDGTPVGLPTPSAPGRLDQTEDLRAILGPAQGSGEIGRLRDYRVLRVLGQGGMGIVLEAEDLRLKRKVALKIMRKTVAASARARKRFLREAEAVAAVRSDHVVTIYEVGEDREMPYLVMEYLEGMPLDRWLEDGRRPNILQALRIGRELAEGLAAAHARGLIHRDVKPANIWLEATHGGRIKILDFGLARSMLEDMQLTQSGAIIGTPGYMAPEQARGEKVDYRTDLFGLGAVLYRLTTGQLPFRGENALSMLSSLAQDTPKPPRELNASIPPSLAVLIESLLAKDRELRPKSAKAVANELATIERELAQDGTTKTANGTRSPVSTVLSGWPPAIVRRWRIVAAVLVSLVGLMVASVVLLGGKPDHQTGAAQVKKNGRAKTDDPRNEQIKIVPAPLERLRPGEPLSPLALVLQPAKLPGVRSWSIVSRQAGSISHFAYRPDGKRLAVGGWDGTVRIWEPQTKRLVQVLLMPSAASALAWSPDGQVLAVGSGLAKRATYLYDANSGLLLRTFASPANDYIAALAWSPDGRKVRAWGDLGRCCTWEATTGRLLHAPAIACKAAVFSRDGRRLAGIVGDKQIQLWDTDTGKPVGQFAAPAALWALAWSPDGTRLAATSKDGLRVWNADAQKEVFHQQNGGSDVNPPAWSPDGRRVVFSLDKEEGAVMVDVAGGTEPQPLDDRGGSFFTWSPDGATIARANGWPWIRLYDVATGRQLYTLTEGAPLLAFAWAPDGQTLAVAESFDTSLISAATGQRIAEWKGATGPLAWSPHGKYLAACGPDNVLLLREPGGKVRPLPARSQARITSLAWSPDGKRLASTAAAEKRVLIWDVVKGDCERELGPFRGPAKRVQWSRDGRLVTFQVPEVGWHVWEVEKGQLVNDPNQWNVSWFDLAPDGRTALVAPSPAEAFRLRDLTSGKDGACLPLAQAPHLATPTWSPDGGLLALTQYSGLHLWRADLSARLRIFQPRITASQLGFSRDGKRLAMLNGERLYLWDTETGKPLGVLLPGSQFHGLTVAASGHYTGNVSVERGIVMVVQKDDGAQELLEPADFERRYGWKNRPDQVHLGVGQ